MVVMPTVVARHRLRLQRLLRLMVASERASKRREREGVCVCVCGSEPRARALVSRGSSCRSLLSRRRLRSPSLSLALERKRERHTRASATRRRSSPRIRNAHTRQKRHCDTCASRRRSQDPRRRWQAGQHKEDAGAGEGGAASKRHASRLTSANGLSRKRRRVRAAPPHRRACARVR